MKQKRTPTPPQGFVHLGKGRVESPISDINTDIAQLIGGQVWEIGARGINPHGTYAVRLGTETAKMNHVI